VADHDSGIVKVCGISTADAAACAIAVGANAIGFIFAESRRQVSASKVRSILDAVDHRDVRAVGVFVNPDIEGLPALIEESGVDVVQLSGDESPEILDHIDTEVWKSFRFGDDMTEAAAAAELERWLGQTKPPSKLHLDALIPGLYGGSGHVANWQLAAALARHYPVILAGGLTPENVETAIREVQPRGVDTSSGVERNGTKDPGRIADFVHNAWGALDDT
jgi:phosphoribosylanthranilate isomerase